MPSKQIEGTSKIVSAAYIEEGYEPIPNVYLDDKAYGDALQRFCPVCVDVLIVNRSRKTVFLGKRISKPQRDIWWIGGGLSARETKLEAAVANFKRETGVLLEPSRLTHFLVADYFWKDRAQQPDTVGCHVEGHVFHVELADEEISLVRAQMTKGEYDQDFGLKEMSRSDLTGNNAHPVLILAYDTIFSS